MLDTNYTNSHEWSEAQNVLPASRRQIHLHYGVRAKR
jgi:hypothetical protein